MAAVITISSVDRERLSKLLQHPDYSSLPSAETLETKLSQANVVEPTEVPADVVTVNSTVAFIDDDSEQELELTLVYPDNTNDSNTVSVFAPVGIALLGLSVGQSIEWQVPGGNQLNLRLLRVSRQLEAEDKTETEPETNS